MIIYKYLNNYITNNNQLYTNLNKINFIGVNHIITNCPDDIINYDKNLINKTYDTNINYWLNNNLNENYVKLNNLTSDNPYSKAFCYNSL